jgi:hypothetical protein
MLQFPVKIPHFQSLGTYKQVKSILWLFTFLVLIDVHLIYRFLIDRGNRQYKYYTAGTLDFLYSESESTVICRHTFVFIYSIKYTFFRNIWNKICRFKYFSLSYYVLTSLLSPRIYFYNWGGGGACVLHKILLILL